MVYSISQDTMVSWRPQRFSLLSQMLRELC